MAQGAEHKGRGQKGSRGEQGHKRVFTFCTLAGRGPVCDPRVLPKVVFLRPNRCREGMRKTGGAHTILEVVLGVGKENRRCTYN